MNKLIVSGEINSPADINSCYHPSLTCLDFADEVMSKLEADDCNGVEVIGIDNFLMHDEEGVIDGSEFNREWIAEHWPTMEPPDWFGWDKLNELSRCAHFDAGTHVWLHCDGLHYDSECCHGVRNPFELPFFERVIHSFNDSVLLIENHDVR